MIEVSNFCPPKPGMNGVKKKPEPKPGRMVRLGLPSEMQRGPFLRGKAGKATDHIRRFPEMGVPPNHLPSGKCLHKTMENHHF